MNTKELTDELEILAPPSYAMSWDNPGLLVGDMSSQITKVYLSLDASLEAVERAAKEGCDMIITHHPMIFSPVKSVTQDDFIGKRIIMMIKNGINYYAMHTNYDIAVLGTLVSEKLGISVEMPLEITQEDPVLGIGTVGDLDKEMKLSELAGLVRQRFDLPPVRVFGDGDSLIKRVAICPGSGKGMASFAIEAGAQVLITGDVDHHFGIDSLEEGLCVIDAGHHGLEHIFVDHMEEWFNAHHPEVEVIKDNNKSPFVIV